MISAILRAVLTPLLWLMLACAGLTYFLCETTLGLQTTLHLVTKVLPFHIRIQHVKGKLASGFLLENITIQDATHDATIQSIYFSWMPQELLNRKFAINQLIIHKLAIQSNDTSPTDFEFNKIPLLLRHITINQFELNELTFKKFQQDPLTLQNIHLQYNNDGVFFSGKSPYGEWQGTLKQQWNMQWKFHLPNLEMIAAGCHGDLYSSGTIRGPHFAPMISADIQGHQWEFAQGKIQRLSGTLNLSLKPNTLSSLQLQLNDIKIQSYKLKQMQLNLSGQLTKNADNFITTLDLAVDKKHYINLTVSLPKTTTLDNYTTQDLIAKLNLDFTRVDSLAKYIPNVTNLHGTIQGSLVMNGNLSQPKISSEISLLNGNVTIPKLGITLSRIKLTILGNDSKRLTYSGSFQSQDGAGQLQGNTDFGQTGFPTQLSLNGKNLQIVNLSEYKIQASPSLQLHWVNSNLFLDGSIHIPSAELTPKNFSDTVTLPSEVVFVGQEKSTAKNLMNSIPTLKIGLTLGDHVHIRYEDLEATLQGNLTITNNPNSPATAVGELYTTTGTYHAYGKTLHIQQGRLIYTGNILTNPGLNIRAGHHINTVQTGSFSTTQFYTGTESLNIGVQVLGTLDSPMISLFSEPSGLSQTDILSYLVLGVPQSQAQGQDSKLLFSAASILNLGGNAPSQIDAITNTLQNKLGLTTLNVESVQTFDPTANKNEGGVVGTQSLVVGKKITDNLMVHYSMSLFANTPVSVLNLRYKISKRFSIQSETSTIDTGADLLYSIERGD